MGPTSGDSNPPPGSPAAACSAGGSSRMSSISEVLSPPAVLSPRKVIVCGPTTLVPPDVARLGVEVAHDLDAILPRCDVLNLLRVQFERQRSGLFPSIREYRLLFGMDGDRMRRARPDVLLLAPGPINRGVEISPDVADGPASAILDQVTNGLAVRMAVLRLLCRDGSLAA